jgi:large subunit ribosomal protein L1
MSSNENTKQVINKAEATKKIEEAIKEGKERNFVQKIDVGFNFRGINFKQPQNRIDLLVNLPTPFMPKPKTLLFASEINLVNTLKPVMDKIISAADVPKLEKKTVKKLARDYDLFFAEPASMAIIGKYLGQVLAPRGKMPKPAPQAVAAIEKIIKTEQESVRITNKKGKSLPTVHFSIGKEDMPVEKIVENFISCYEKVFELLPGKLQNIKSIYFKKTMGKVIYIYNK